MDITPGDKILIAVEVESITFGKGSKRINCKSKRTYNNVGSNVPYYDYVTVDDDHAVEIVKKAEESELEDIKQGY